MTKISLIMIYGIGIYLLVILIMFIFQRSLLYQPSKEKLDISYYNNTGLEKINFTTLDGILLTSLFKKPSKSDNNTIVVFHGNAGHIGHRVHKFKPFIDEGYGLLLLEYRGYGENTGKPTENGLYMDSKAALDFLNNHNIPVHKTILYGESLGCGLAVKFSTTDSFKATILEAPYTSIADVAMRQYWYIPAKWLVLDRYNIMNKIKSIKSPLLVLHGLKDKIINIEFGKRVFNSAPKPKKALYIPDAGHNNLYEFNTYKKVISFLKQN